MTIKTQQLTKLTS